MNRCSNIVQWFRWGFLSTNWSKDKVSFKIINVSDYVISTTLYWPLFVLFKIILCAWSLYVYIWAYLDSNPNKIMTFFTYWTLTIQITYFLLSTLTALCAGLKWITVDGWYQLGPLITLYIQKISLNIACPGSLLVTILYWAFIFQDQELGVIDVHSHVFNSLVMITDIMIISSPFHFYHLYCGFVYGLSYIIFNISYWSFDEDDNVIYDPLNWGQTKSISITLTLLALFIALPIAQLIYHCLFLIRCGLTVPYNIMDNEPDGVNNEPDGVNNERLSVNL